MRSYEFGRQDQKFNEAEGKITKQGNNETMNKGEMEGRKTEGMIEPKPWIIASYKSVKLSKSRFQEWV